MKFKDILLKTVFSQLVSALWFLAESVRISTSMVGHDAPSYCSHRPQTQSGGDNILESDILCCWSITKSSTRTSFRITSSHSTWTEHWSTAWVTPGVPLCK